MGCDGQLIEFSAMSFVPTASRQFMSPLLYACVITGLGISNSRQGKEREVLLHKILRVAHSVAQITAKAAQTSPFRCGTMYRKLLICIRPGYYLANFKTAGFNRSPTPPPIILTHSTGDRGICTCGTLFSLYWCLTSRWADVDPTSALVLANLVPIMPA